jgi:hypothetical protein
MTQIHELDRIRHWGDGYDDVNKDFPTWPQTVEMLIRRHGTPPITPENPMLGLGAGQGYPELSLAELMGIPHDSVVLLDRAFGEVARDRLARVAPSVPLIEQGLFTYLQNPDGRKYSLVTTFGMHDALGKDNIEEFFRLLPNVLVECAVVFLQHNGFQDYSEEAARYGFNAKDECPHLFLYQDMVIST